MHLPTQVTLFLTSECFAQLLVPLALLVSVLGLLGWWGQYVVPPLLEVALIDKWHDAARFMCRIMHCI